MQSIDVGSWQTSLSAFDLVALLSIATNRILMRSLFRALGQLLHWPVRTGGGPAVAQSAGA